MEWFISPILDIEENFDIYFSLSSKKSIFKENAPTSFSFKAIFSKEKKIIL
jgi:hypothetical protein